MQAVCAAFFLIIRTAISNPYATGRLSFRPAVLLSVFVPFGLGQTISQNHGNETVLPIWGLSTVVQGGTSPLCNQTFANANGTTQYYFNPNVAQGPQAGQPDNYSGKTLAAGYGLTLSNPGFDSSNSSNTSSAYTLWYDTNGANYSDRYALGHDVCALVGLSLNYNTQLRGQSDNGSCTATLDSPCITAIQATVQQYAAWYTTPSQGTPSNLTGTSLPNVCRLLTHALIENFPNQCSYFFEDKLDSLAFPLTSYGDQYQTGLTPSCTLNGTWQNALSFYNNNSQSIYDAWVDSVTPVILVWMPIADASAQTSITEVVSDIWCGRITNLSADSYVPPALPSPTPVAYMTNTGSNSTSSNIIAVGSMSASGMSSSDAISGGAIAGIVIGVLAGVALLAVLALWLLWRKRKSRNAIAAHQGHDTIASMAELHGYDTHHEMGLDGERVQLPANKEEGGPWSIARRAELEDSRALGELEGSEGLKHEHEGVELPAHGE